MEYVKYGATQGSVIVLRPLPFTFCINDLSNIGLKGTFFMYGYDLCTCIFIHTSKH